MKTGCGLSLCTVLLLVLFAITGCADEAGALRIEPQTERYLPTMSSTPGLGLSVVASRDLKNSEYQFHWVAEEGTLLRWSRSGTGRVHELGSEAWTDEHRVYWRPPPGEATKGESFSVHVSVVNRNTGEIAETASLLIHRDAAGAFCPETDGS